jgi:hypothetical protein
MWKALLLCLLFNCLYCISFAQVKILFDATKAESAGNADWVIDADAHNLDWNPDAEICSGSSCHQSNAQRIPTPAQSTITASTPETYWEGALSNWGIDCVNKGYTVESLPYNVAITYGDIANPQDLSNYKVYIVCEPNILFTAAEKTAILSFVNNGGGLFMVSDHAGSDRNNDGYDSPQIWDDLLQTNSTSNSNPFGIIFDSQDFSETSTNLASLPATDSILHGPMGNVTEVEWSGGNTMTISPTANPSVKAVIYQSSVSPATGDKDVMVAYSRYGKGKVAAIGDSSPCDDGTGDPMDELFNGYTGDVPPNHRNLLMNITIWLAAQDVLPAVNYTFTGNGNWDVPANWSSNTIPPSTLPSPDSIIINPVSGGQCVLNVIQNISAGASIQVLTGKNLLIPGELKIQ